MAALYRVIRSWRGITAPATGAILTAALLLNCVSAGAAPTEAEHLVRAKAYVTTGDLVSATLELKSALQKNPGNLEARWLLGQAYLDLGQGEAAEKEIAHARKLGLADDVYQPALVRSLYLQQDMDRVIEAASELAPGLSPGDQALVLSFLGKAWAEKGHADEAHQVLNRALAIDPNSPDVLTAMATLSIVRKNRAAAYSWLERAHSADPNYVDAWTLRGHLLLADDKVAEAETAFSKAIELRKYANPDRAFRAMARLRLANIAGAEADIEALKLAGFEQHPLATHAAGAIALERGDFASAIDELETSYAGRPSSEVALLLAAAHLLAGHSDLAISYQSRVIGSEQGSTRRLLSILGPLDPGYLTVEPLLESLLARNPNDAVVLDLLGQIALLNGNTAKSDLYFQKLVQLKPDSEADRQLLWIGESTAKNESTTSREQAAAPTDDEHLGDYDRAFLTALAHFQAKRVNLALTQAQRIAERYPDRVDPINLIAASYLIQSQFDPGRLMLEHALRLEPDNQTARINLAKIDLQQGRLQQALELIAPVAGADPERQQAAQLLASIELRLQAEEGGIGQQQSTSEQGPGDDDSTAARAVNSLQVGQPARALELIRDLPESDVQTEPRILAVKGRAELLTGDFQAAKETFEVWAGVEPGSADAHFFFAEALIRNNDLATAIERSNEALRIKPNHLLAGVAQVKALAWTDKPQEAEAAIDRLKSRHGDVPDVLGIEGWLALGTGQYERAANSLAAAADARPSTEVTILHARALQAQSRQPAAIDVLRQWQQVHPQDLPVLRELAAVYIASGMEPEARQTYTQILALTPDDVLALNDLAWLKRKDDVNGAIELAERAFNLAPEQPQVLDTLGMLLAESGNLSAGYEHVARAADLAPNDPDIQLNWGRLLLQMERQQESHAVLSELVSRFPESPQATSARRLIDGSTKAAADE